MFPVLAMKHYLRLFVLFIHLSIIAHQQLSVVLIDSEYSHDSSIILKCFIDRTISIVLGKKFQCKFYWI